MTLINLLEVSPHQEERMYGALIGIVTNNKDPDGLGRVKVKFPRLGQNEESNWARMAVFMAGSGCGAFFLPEVNDEVLVIFEHGDMSMPYIVGSLWNGVDKPPEKNSDGKNNIRMIQSRSGHQVKLTDEDGKEKIEIIDKSKKNSIVLDTAKNTITIDAKEEIKIITKNGKIAIEAKEATFKFQETLKIQAKKLEIKTDAAIKIEGGADIDLKASGKLNAKGSTINLN